MRQRADVDGDAGTSQLAGLPRCLTGRLMGRHDDGLLGGEEPISRLRGTWREYRDGDFAARLMPTYHPAALLRNPELKKYVWKDMKALKAELDSAG